MIRAKGVILPRRNPLVEQFADHMAADAKQLVEDEQTGAKSYRYVRTAADHLSLAFTYDCIAWSRLTPGAGGARFGRVVPPAVVVGPW